MRLRTWSWIGILGLVAACSDGPTEPSTGDLPPSGTVGSDVGPAAAPAGVAHFNLTSGGEGVGPTVTTDKDDYQPGDTVTISGSGWQAGETVELVIEEDTPGADLLVFSSVADDNGDFVNRDLVIEERHLGVTFTLTATGLTSGLTAGAGFTDTVGSAPVVTREATCTTGQSSFALGDAVCAYVGPVGTSGSSDNNLRVQWVGPSPSITVLHTDSLLAVASNSYHSKIYTPSAAGTYTVRTCKGLTSDCLGGNQFASATFTITAPANTAPVLTLPANHSVQWGVALDDTAKATDAESPPQTLTFSLIAPLVSGVSINGSTGVISWTPTVSQIGAKTITVRVVDNGTPALADTAAYVVTVTERPASLVYDGKLAGQYSDNDTLSATLTDSGEGATNGDPIVGESVSFVFDAGGSNLAAGNDNTDSSGQAAVVYQIPKPDGNYTVTANFAGGSGYSAVSDTVTFDVDPEDATVTAAAGNPEAVQVASPGGTSGLFSLVFAVQETNPEPDANDGALAGNIDLTGLSVTLVAVGAGSNFGPVVCGGVAAGAGYAGIKTFTCDFTGVPVNTYEVNANVTGVASDVYYTGSTVEALTIYDPSLGFITGGGTFYLGGERINFGFTMKYNKKGTNPQGSLLVIRHTPTGKYRAKSNQLSALAIANDGSATFSGKATYIEPGWATTVGNQSFTVYVKDVGEPGVGRDKFWVSVGGNTAGLKMATPATSNAATLTGGNIQVPHTK